MKGADIMERKIEEFIKVADFLKMYKRLAEAKEYEIRR